MEISSRCGKSPEFRDLVIAPQPMAKSPPNVPRPTPVTANTKLRSGRSPENTPTVPSRSARTPLGNYDSTTEHKHPHILLGPTSRSDSGQGSGLGWVQMTILAGLVLSKRHSRLASACFANRYFRNRNLPPKRIQPPSPPSRIFRKAIPKQPTPCLRVSLSPCLPPTAYFRGGDGGCGCKTNVFHSSQARSRLRRSAPAS